MQTDVHRVKQIPFINVKVTITNYTEAKEN